MYPEGQNVPPQTPEPSQDYSPYQQPLTQQAPTVAPSQNQDYQSAPNSWAAQHPINQAAQQPAPQPQNFYQSPPQQATQPIQSTPPTYPPNPQQPPYNSPTPQAAPHYATTPAPSVDYMGSPSTADEQEYSIDYLNKIAPKEQKTVNKFAMLGLIGAGIFVAIFAFIIMLSPGKTTDVKSQVSALSGRVTTLATVTDEQKTNLNEEQIYAANTALNASLGSMSTKLTTYMKTAKIKGNKNQIAAEKIYATKLSKTLSDAYQRGTLDRTYTTQMTYELSILRSQLTTLKKSTTSSNLQTLCTTGVHDVDSVLKTFSEFSATKS